uniref:Uncharacterized protein n=1 Tax=Oryza punctata TaxID=4537 RepID=A0A0E0LYA8_ORYPU
MFSFNTFDFMFDISGLLQQVSLGVVGPVQDIQFPAGARPAQNNPRPPALRRYRRHRRQDQPLRQLLRSRQGRHDSDKATRASRPIQAPPSPTASECGSKWVGFLDTSEHIPYSMDESSNDTPTSSHKPRDIFIILQSKTNAERQEHEAKEWCIRQQQEELTKRMEELRQRGRSNQEAIPEAKLGEHDFFMTPQHNIVVAKALLDNITFPEDPMINSTSGGCSAHDDTSHHIHL